MPRRVAVGGSAANYPQLTHLELQQALVDSGMFDEVNWIISGERPDKRLVSPIDRKVMTEMLVGKIQLPEGVVFKPVYDDLYRKNTPTIEWFEFLQSNNPDVIYTWYTGSDSVVPQERWGGECEIERRWVRGRELVANWNILVVPRARYQLPPLGHPLYTRFKNLIILGKTLKDISSTEGRRLIQEGLPFEHLTLPDIAGYIKEKRLYGYRPEGEL